MKYGKFIITFTLLFSMTISASAQITTKNITFKKDMFDAAIKNLVEPNVMGYQYVLIKDGKVVTEGADGQARTGTDGNLKMTTSTPQNIGSLMKFLSGTTMINLFEKPNAKTDPNYKDNTLQQNLDRKIWTEFPKVWLDQIPASNTQGLAQQGITQRNITFRQLLQHRSGFDETWKGKTDGTLLSQLKNQFNVDLYGKRLYTNFNFTLGGFLLPLIESHNLNNDLNKETNGKSQTDADKILRDKLGMRMDALMRERIWNKMSPKFNATCDPKKDVKDTAAYAYPNKGSKGGGEFFSSMENNGHCVGVGGYFTSARDLANYAAHFSKTDLIVTQTGRDAMFKDGMPSNDRLVWSEATQNPWINTNFKMTRVAWSNGIAGNSKSVLLRLPDNYYLVLFVNSGELSVSELFTVGTLAFKEGMKHNF